MAEMLFLVAMAVGAYGQCNEGSWSGRNLIVCGECEVYVQSMQDTQIAPQPTCKAYCASQEGGLACAGARDDINSGCSDDGKSYDCDSNFGFTIDAICKCVPRSAAGLASAEGSLVSSALGSCDAYCKAQGSSCQGAWEDSANSCSSFASKEDCSTDIKLKYSGTSDMCCACGAGVAPTPAASGQRVSADLGSCGAYCASQGLGCSGAWEDKDNSCTPFLAVETCATDIKTKHSTSDMCCACGGSVVPTPRPAVVGGFPASCSGGSPKCISGSPKTGGSPAGMSIGFIGDTGGGSGFGRVLQLLKNNGVDLILHAGDLGYTSATPSTWHSKIESIMGSSFPYIAAIGNHDSGTSAGWSLSQSYEAIYKRAQKVGSCKGQTGAFMVCTWNGVTIMVAAADEVGSLSSVPAFIRDTFYNYPNKWRICMWHKNQKKMQMGDKSDSVGWAIYEECRKQGAIVLTGHQHHYSRSHTMTNAEGLKVLNKNNQLELRMEDDGPGTNFVLVSGLGGYDSRSFDSSLTGLNHWAAKANNLEGALICDFATDTASCKFKDHSGNTKDSFTVKSFVQEGKTPFRMSAFEVFDTLSVQVASSADVGMESKAEGSSVVCGTPHLHLGYDQGPNLVGVRFPAVNLDPSNIKDVIRAYIEFRVGQGSTFKTDLLIRGEVAASSKPICGSGAEKLSARSRSRTAVYWTDVEMFEEHNNGAHTPDITALLREMVTSKGWAKGGALTFLIEGTGKRSVRSWSEEHESAPILVLQTQVIERPQVDTTRPGCTFEHNVEFIGADVVPLLAALGAPVVGIEESDACCKQCQSQSTCKSFALKQGKCTLFSSVGTRALGRPDVISGAILAHAVPEAAPPSPAVGTTTRAVFIEDDSPWRYLAKEPYHVFWYDASKDANDATADGGTWKTGVPPFGFGDARVTYGTTIDNKIETNLYFRHSFSLTTGEKAGLTAATLKFRSDHGANVWVNGISVYQDQEPTKEREFDTDAGLVKIDLLWELVAGDNVISVEIFNPLEVDSDGTRDAYFGSASLTIDYVPDVNAASAMGSSAVSLLAALILLSLGF